MQINPNTINTALANLVQRGTAIRADLGVESQIMRSIRDQGFVKVVGFQKNTDETGKPIAGRPAPIYRATDKGRKRGKRFLAAQA